MMATFATVDVVIIFFSFVSSVQFLINKFPDALYLHGFSIKDKKDLAHAYPQLGGTKKTCNTKGVWGLIM